MKAILLVNMGAPGSEKEMRLFLKRMFEDKAIINAPYWIRISLSLLISRLRYRNSWKKYELIGGSKLRVAMDTLKMELQKRLPEGHLIETCYSYSNPLIGETITTLYQKGYAEITVLSMYPQSSLSTTGSIASDIEKVRKKHKELNIRLVEHFYNHPKFISFWTELIQTKRTEVNYRQPYLLFSAHAIPASFIKRGDRYSEQLEDCVCKIASQLNLPYSLSYQSKIGRIEWTRPYTYDTLKELSDEGIDEIIIIPISFMNENLETQYDLDIEILPYAKQTLNINKICRIQIPTCSESLVELFFELTPSTHA